jgi:hypothetical protein
MNIEPGDPREKGHLCRISFQDLAVERVHQGEGFGRPQQVVIGFLALVKETLEKLLVLQIRQVGLGTHMLRGQDGDARVPARKLRDVSADRL